MFNNEFNVGDPVKIFHLNMDGELLSLYGEIRYKYRPSHYDEYRVKIWNSDEDYIKGQSAITLLTEEEALLYKLESYAQ